MSDILERYRQAWIKEQEDEQKRLQAEEWAYRDKWRHLAAQFIEQHDLADLLRAFAMGNAEFPSCGSCGPEIIFPLQLPYNGGHLFGWFSLFPGEETVLATIVCGHGTLELPATDAAIGRWLCDLDSWALSADRC